MPGIVTSSNVSYAYPETSTNVLTNVTFSIPAGSRVIILGENGAGKSTLLRLINGNHKSLTGSLTIDDHDAFEDTHLRRRVKYLSSSLPGYLQYLKSQHTVEQILHSQDALHSRSLLNDFGLHPETSLAVLSDGELRKLQILMHIVQPFDMLLVDECTKDVDVVGRKVFLDALRRTTSETPQSTVLYATHILDDMQQWATHVLHVDNGAVVLHTIAEIPCVYAFARTFSGLSQSGVEGIVAAFRSRMALFPVINKSPAETSAVHIGNFDVKRFFRQTGPLSQQPISESAMAATVFIPEGSRVILCGPNGSGKSVILQLLAGERFYSKKSDMHLLLGERVCFHDTGLVADVAYGGHWWDDAEPEWNLTVEEMLTCRAEDWAGCAYARYIIDLLGIDMRWRVNAISSGERKRVQLLLRLVPLRSFIFLDEATADLDVALRQKFLIFLQHVSLCRGVTVIYCSHIYEDLMWWGNYALFTRASRDFIDTITEKYGKFIHRSRDCQGSFLSAKTERVSGVDDIFE